MGDAPKMPSPAAIPATTTSNINSIPEQLMPNVKTLLGAADKQIYQMNDQNQVTGFQPYVPYSTNAGDYIAPFSPMQQQAQQGAANLQTPGQFAPASQLAGIGGIGSMLAGQNYQNQATDPNSLSAYMSPFMQNVMQQQGRELNRNYDISGTQQQGAATQAGAFGGSREALMASENERNRNMALNKMQAEGLQNAYTAANTNQQFGANLGLQGMGQGVTAAGQLGQLGTQQLAAETSVLGTQSQMGGQQQTQQQNAINQAVLDYQNAQQYPYMQMGTMSDLLRGTPLRSAGDVTYQAQPSALTQGIGTIGSLGAAYMGMQNRKEGGIIQEKGYANGGIVGYKEGTVVKDDVEGRTRKYLENLDQSQLAEFIRTSPSEEASAMAKEIYQTNSTAGTMAPPIQQTAGTQMYAKGGIMGYKGGEGIEDEFEGVGSKEGKLHSLLHGKGMKYRAMSGDKDRRQVEYATGGIVAFKETGGVEDKLLKEMEAANEKYKKDPNKQRLPFDFERTIVDNDNLQNVDKDLAAQERIDATVAARQGIVPTPVTTQAPAAAPQAPVERAPAATQAPAEQAPAGIPITKAPQLDWLQSVEKDINQEEKPLSFYEKQLKDAYSEAGVKSASELYGEERKRLDEEKAGLDKDAEKENWMTVSKIFANWGRTPGPILSAGLNALSTSIPDFIKTAKDKTAFEKASNKARDLLDRAENAEKRGDVQAAYRLRTDASKIMLEKGEIMVKARAEKAKMESNERTSLNEIEAKHQDTASTNAAHVTAARVTADGKTGKKLTPAQLAVRVENANKEYSKKIKDMGYHEKNEYNARPPEEKTALRNTYIRELLELENIQLPEALVSGGKESKGGSVQLSPAAEKWIK
jgi:hypothetical protein